MRDYFKPLRRKMGVVTLVLALAAMGGWFRSQSRFEYVFINVGKVSIGVTSMHEGLDFARTIALDQNIRTNFIDYKSVELHVLPDDPFNRTPWSADFKFDWRWDWAGFHVGEGQYPERRDQDCMIPYWSIVIPLTLLAAWLLLSKPRRSKATALAGDTFGSVSTNASL